MTKIINKENLKKFIKKYNQITQNHNIPDQHGFIPLMDEEDAGWLQGVNDLMSALRIDIKYLDKYNELNDKTKGDL